jgi:hypothetical protein
LSWGGDLGGNFARDDQLQRIGETVTETKAPLRPHLGEPHHHAYIVDEIEEAVDRLVGQLGAGPFFLIERVPLESVLSRGEHAEFVHNSAFGQCAGSPIELIEPISLGPERVESGFSGARPRLHHIAFVVPLAEVADLRGRLDERGLPEYLSSWFGGVETTVHDARATLGHDLEIHAENEGLRQFFGMVRDAAETWDGTEALRPVEL